MGYSFRTGITCAAVLSLAIISLPGLDTFQNPEGWFSYIDKAITSLNRSLASKKVMGRKRIRNISRDMCNVYHSTSNDCIEGPAPAARKIEDFTYA